MTIEDLIQREQKEIDTYAALIKTAIDDSRLEATIDYARKLEKHYDTLMTLQFAKLEIE